MKCLVIPSQPHGEGEDDDEFEDVDEGEDEEVEEEVEVEVEEVLEVDGYWEEGMNVNHPDDSSVDQMAKGDQAYGYTIFRHWWLRGRHGELHILIHQQVPLAAARHSSRSRPPLRPA